MTDIAGQLSISGQPELLRVNRFPQLMRLGGALTIGGNPKVPECDARALVAMLTARGYSGSMTISDTDRTSIYP